MRGVKVEVSDARLTKSCHLLDQMRDPRVPEQVCGDVLLDPGPARRPPEHLGNPGVCDRAALGVEVDWCAPLL